MVLGFHGWLRNLLGEFSEARDAFTRAIRLSPLDANIGIIRSGLAMALTFKEPPQLEEALELCRYVLEGAPTLFPALQGHIEILVSQGKVVEAREAARRLMSLYPSSSISAWRRRWPHRPKVIEKMTALYRTAGIPE
jgi:tetratricopeptide (TPR) repeat protein